MPFARQPPNGSIALTPSHKRRVFLAGTMLVEAMEADPECRNAVLQELDLFLTQPRDRQLFDLPPLPPVCPGEDTPHPDDPNTA